MPRAANAPALAALVLLTITAASAPARGDGFDQQLAKAVTREGLVRIARDRSPALSAGRMQASATRAMGEARRRLPAPEADLQVWQIPLARPYDLPGAGMVMVSLKQPIPAPGSLGARAEVSEREADVETAMVAERELDLSREVGHAFVDYLEAHERHRVHLEHKDAADRITAVAHARYAAGGSLTDATQADVEAARIEADIAQEQARVASARARINGLLLRDPAAALGPPETGAPRSVAEPDADLIARALAHRPEPRTARARTAQRQAESRASEREASWPMLAVGASYFAPTRDMPSHAWGLSVSTSLPWLWGRARAESKASRAMAAATGHLTQDAEARVRTEVSTRAADVRSGAARLRVLQHRALSSARLSWEAAAAGYESGRTDILMLLSARKAMVEIEVDIVDAHAAIEHALVELQWAVGGNVRTAPVTGALAGSTP